MSATKKADKGRVASPAQCRRVLSALPFLENVGQDDIEELCVLMRVRDFVAGSTIFYEDDDSDAVYFIELGSVEVFKSDGTGRKMPLAVLRNSGVLGEMGLLLQTPRTASARTLCAVRTLVMPSAAIHAALQNNSLAAYRLVTGFARVLSQRLALVDQKLFELCEETQTEPRRYSDFDQNLLHVP